MWRCLSLLLTVVWTDEGEVCTLGFGMYGQLGLLGLLSLLSWATDPRQSKLNDNEYLPRLVEALLA